MSQPLQSAAPPPPAGTGRARKWGWAGAALVVASAFLAYHNSLSVPFHFDDRSGVVNNPTIRQLWPLGQVLSPPDYATGAGGRPLVNLSLAFNHALGGLDPAGYHLFNLCAHALAGVLLLRILHRCLTGLVLHNRHGGSAWLLATGAAVWWTVHPLQSESVTCVIQRSEVLGGLCYLLTVHLFLRGIGSSVPGRWQVAAALAALLGALTKEFIVTAPLVIFVTDATLFAGGFRAAWRRRWPAYAGLLASWVVVGFLIAHNGQRGGSVGFNLGVSAWDYLMTQGRAVVLYLRLAIWPQPLVLDYGSAVDRFPAVWPQVLGVTSLVAATILLVRRGSAWAVPGVWFFAILAPSSSFVPLATQTTAEHRMYLPLAAVLVPAVLGLHRLVRRPALTGAGLLLVATGLGIATWQRNFDYRDAVTLWSDTVAKVPDNPRAHLNLGAALVEAGRRTEAIPRYREALRLDPAYIEAHYNLGNALAQTGDPAGAERHYRECLRLQPGQPRFLNNLGTVQSQLGRRAEAIASFAAVVRLDPLHAGAHFNWGQELAAARQLNEAARLLARAVELRPEHPRYRVTLAETLLGLGRAPEAIAQLEQAVMIEPEDAAIRLALGQALLAANRPKDAVASLEQASRLQPDLPGLRNQLRVGRRLAGLANAP